MFKFDVRYVLVSLCACAPLDDSQFNTNYSTLVEDASLDSIPSLGLDAEVQDVAQRDTAKQDAAQDYGVLPDVPDASVGHGLADGDDAGFEDVSSYQDTGTNISEDAGLVEDLGVQQDAAVYDASSSINWSWSDNKTSKFMSDISSIYAAGHVWAIGGREVECAVDGLKYHPFLDVWMVGLSRIWVLEPVLATNDDELVVLGGKDCGPIPEELNHSGVYSTFDLSRLSIDFPTILVDPGVVSVGDDFIIVGGECSFCFSPVPRPIRVNTKTGQITPLSNTLAPGTISTARSPALIWDEGKLIVYSGLASSSGIWDETLDSWSSMPLPEPSVEPLTWVATDIELLVWDGVNGAKFDLGTQSWSRTSTINAPPVAGQGVWTGEEWVIFWSDGAAHYNPQKDQWASAVADNARWPQNGQQPVWTGHEIILHGADIDDGQNTSARYGPRLVQSRSCLGLSTGMNIRIISPAARTIVKDGFTAEAEINSKRDISELRWFIDNQLVASSGLNVPISIDTSQIDPADHILRLEVQDSTGAVVCFEQVNFIDPEPKIQLSSPHSVLSQSNRIVHFKASCTDVGPGGCKLVLDIPGLGLIRSETDTLDEMVDLSSIADDDVEYTITAFDGRYQQVVERSSVRFENVP